MDDKRFLKQLALVKFDQQYNRFLNIDELDIFSIAPDYAMERGYEIFTVYPSDKFRIRIYVNFTNRDFLNDYRLEVDNNEITNALGDEVFVAMGEVDKDYITSGQTSFPWIPIPVTAGMMLIQENGEPLLLESGDYILLE